MFSEVHINLETHNRIFRGSFKLRLEITGYIRDAHAERMGSPLGCRLTGPSRVSVTVTVTGCTGATDTIREPLKTPGKKPWFLVEGKKVRDKKAKGNKSKNNNENRYNQSSNE